MIAAFKKAYASLRGGNSTHGAVPPMEGPLRPNTKLDEMPVALMLDAIDNLVVSGETMACSSGAQLITLSRAGHETASKLSVTQVVEQPALISCMASDGNGALAIGLDGIGIVIQGGKHDGLTIDRLAGAPLSCPTAALFIDPDTLALANGSSEHHAGDWKRDLMSQGSTGSVWIVDLAAAGSATASTLLAQGLAYPSGIALMRNGGIFVSEAWRHRVLSVDRKGGTPTIALQDLPAYPGRIEAAMAGGYWLSFFAPRNPMVEFVLLEEEYRDRMMETINPEFWIAPSLAPSKSYLQPIQGGARKMLNRLKPWSPSWSYGLVCYCDADMRPRWSMHSRADGHVHGITTLCECDGTLFAGAKGSGLIVAAPVLEMHGLEA